VSATPGGIQQFGRVATLLLFNQTGEGIDLSELRFHFEISASDVETPNTATIRVYNLAATTIDLAIQEYTNVVISAGYEGNTAEIFKGTVKQYRRGKEHNVDSFLDIYAADSDTAYNFGLVSTSLQAGNSPAQRAAQLVSGMQASANAAQTSVDATAAQGGISLDPAATQYLNGTGGILPRGKVMFGLARSYMRDLAVTAKARWSIQNGVVVLIPLSSYIQDNPIVLNSATGLIGVPEATEQGIVLECLLNPLIRIGRPVRLNNADITSTTIKQQFFPGYTDFNLIASVDSSTDGLYRPVVVEHSGDTRDTPWYTKIIALLIDQSSPQSNSVAPYGIPAGG
jgi:hypothetical protein